MSQSCQALGATGHGLGEDNVGREQGFGEAGTRGGDELEVGALVLQVGRADGDIDEVGGAGLLECAAAVVLKEEAAAGWERVARGGAGGEVPSLCLLEPFGGARGEGKVLAIHERVACRGRHNREGGKERDEEDAGVRSGTQEGKCDFRCKL